MRLNCLLLSLQLHKQQLIHACRDNNGDLDFQRLKLRTLYRYIYIQEHLYERISNPFHQLPGPSTHTTIKEEQHLSSWKNSSVDILKKNFPERKIIQLY